MSEWEAYLGKLTREQQDRVRYVLDYAQALSPDAAASMPYGVPGLKLGGKPLIAVAAHKAHYGVYPFSPGVIEAAKPLLAGLETAKGTIRFDYSVEPSRELIQRLVELRTNEIGGKS